MADATIPTTTDRYNAWMKERRRLSAMEDEGGPGSGAWADSDDDAVDLLHAAMAEIAAINRRLARLQRTVNTTIDSIKKDT